MENNEWFQRNGKEAWRYGGWGVRELGSMAVVGLSGCRVVGVAGQFRDCGYKQGECFLPQRTPRFKLIRGLALSELHSFILRLSFSRSLRKKAEAFFELQGAALVGCKL